MFKLVNSYMNSLFYHPKSVSMSYIEHFNFSLNLSYLFFCGSIKAFIHAIYPDSYICSSSDYSQQINKMIQDKHDLCYDCKDCK
jgi:hypothetical protein